jgi:hypothetical protein
MKIKIKALTEAVKKNKNALARKTLVLVGAAAGMFIASAAVDNYRKNGDANPFDTPLTETSGGNPFDHNPFNSL